MTSTTTQKSPAEIAKLLEGVDFIETEEDAKAVEAATLKIQSTFRGKKFRSKLASKSEKEPVEKEKLAKIEQEEQLNSDEAARELSKKVAEMEFEDKKASANSLPEEEVERAATKIQAGFKGYKTRKELEGKLPASTVAPSGGQQSNETSGQS